MKLSLYHHYKGVKLNFRQVDCLMRMSTVLAPHSGCAPPVIVGGGGWTKEREEKTAVAFGAKDHRHLEGVAKLGG